MYAGLYTLSKPEERFSTGSKPARSVSEIPDL